MRNKIRTKLGNKIVAITKYGITRYIPVRPIEETEGFISGLDIENLRDETDRIS